MRRLVRKGIQQLTSLSSVTAGNTSAELLVVNEPLEKTAHDTAALPEGGVRPRLLSILGLCNLFSNLGLVVGQEGAQVESVRRVERSDPFASRCIGIRLEFGECEMRFNGGVWDFMAFVGWVCGLHSRQNRDKGQNSRLPLGP